MFKLSAKSEILKVFSLFSSFTEMPNGALSFLLQGAPRVSYDYLELQLHLISFIYSLHVVQSIRYSR